MDKEIKKQAKKKVAKKEANKKTIEQRLNIIKGQINGLSHLIEKNEDCHKITVQFYAINLALKKVMEVYLKENLSFCLSSLKTKERKDTEFLLEQIIKNK